MISLAEIIIGLNREAEGGVEDAKQFLAAVHYVSDQAEYPDEVIAFAAACDPQTKTG